MALDLSGIFGGGGFGIDIGGGGDIGGLGESLGLPIGFPLPGGGGGKGTGGGGGSVTIGGKSYPLQQILNLVLSGLSLTQIFKQLGGSGTQALAPSSVNPNVVTTGLTSAQKTSASQAGTDALSATSGFANPDYLQSIINNRLGAPTSSSGDIQGIINQLYGFGGSTARTAGGSGAVIDSLLQQDFRGFS